MTAITSEEYIWSTLHINRFLRGILTPSEFMLLLFDVDRTFRFSKSKENIPYSVYKAGITSRDGNAIIGPVGMSNRSIRNARKGLIEKGLEQIKIGCGRGYSRVTVIFSALKNLIKKEMKKMLKTPKKSKKTRVAKFATLGGNIAPANKVTEVKETESLKDLNKAKTSLRSNSLSTGEKAKQKHIKKRRQNIENITVPTIKNVKVIWGEAIRHYKEKHPSVIVPPPTQKELMLFVCRLKQAFHNDSSWKGVFYRAVSDWDSIIPHFRWLDSTVIGGGAPAVPSIQFIRSFLRQIIEAQQAQLAIEASNKAVMERRGVSIGLDKKSMKSMANKINKLEKQLRREKTISGNGVRKNVELQSKLAQAKIDKDKYYRSLPRIDDNELAAMDLPKYEDLPQSNTH
ncbi:MAG: hypothetical protein BMS9Abin11_1730 [Gammaproteobacteria bacterium]|nr:MAG: hypothetical protein BMS9Abin11_1730 [Gammaproteobacteria bacterium]